MPIYIYNIFSGSFKHATSYFKGISLKYDTPLLNLDDNDVKLYYENWIFPYG